MDVAVQLIKFFSNHHFALSILQAAQHLQGATPLTPILPVITRWTSHFLALRRILELKDAIRACVELHRANLIKSGGRTKAQQVGVESLLSFVDQETF